MESNEVKKLVAYITTGFPDRNFTVDLALALKEAGVDTLELGIPFSDPVADGPVIESANLQSLKNGFVMNDLFEVSARIASEIDTLWMGYFNPFYHMGFDSFLQRARDYGVSGFIIPDLPYEEALPYREGVKESGLVLIDFIAPTDTQERIEMISSSAEKFIYLVAYAGITGSGRSERLEHTVESIRRYSDTPIYVGFGVNRETAAQKAEGVDGVIVGSAFVKILLDDTLRAGEKIERIGTMAAEIKEMINER